MNYILEIFYEKFIPEASVGNVDAFLRYNVLFNTSIGDKLIEAPNRYNVFIPTLKIRDKNLFDSLLIEYVSKCLKFYDFEAEIMDNEYYKVKKVLSFLFANATYEDLENPIAFLKRRIAFLDDETLSDIDRKFTSETLGAEIEVRAEKSKTVNETPYKVRFFIEGEDGTYDLPNVYVGIDGNKAYIYAIQKEKKLEHPESKKIKRRLYKLDEGLDVKTDTFENFEEGNLKDITPSFLLVVNILTGILKEKGITEIIVPSILPERWNAKEIARENRTARLLLPHGAVEESMRAHDQLQSNLTEKLLRTFLRLAHHHTGINVHELPGDVSTDLRLNISSEDECNNPILTETFNINGGRHV